MPSIAKSQEDEEPVDDESLQEDELNAEQLNRLHELMDLNGDGKLSLEETLEYAKRVGKDIARKDIGTILEEMDTSKDGKLSLEEHEADIKQQAQDGDEEEMKELQKRLEVERSKFQAADSSGDGMLDSEELTGLFYPETHDEVLSVTIEETMRQKDRNGDGRLTPHEFWEADPQDGDDGQLTHEENEDFAKLDTNGDGGLDVMELRHWESGRFHTEDAMKKLFEHADKDSDMHVTGEELAAARAEIAMSDAQYHFIEWAEHHEL